MSESYAADLGGFVTEENVERRPYPGGRRYGGAPHHYSELARFGAEALGSFMLILAVLGSLVFAVLSGNSWLMIALTVGTMLAGAMAAVGHVTGGGDFNPAVTIGKAIAGRLAWRHVLPHIAGQIVGAILATAVMWAILPHSFATALGFQSRGELLGTTAPGYGTFSPLSQASNGATEFGFGVAFLAEIIFTALFVAVVLGATRKRARRSGMAPLVVGLTFAALWEITWPITRGGLNPIRAFASVMLSGNTEIWNQLWLFVLGPIIGAALAGLFYRAFHPGVSGELGARSYAVPNVVDTAYVDEPVYAAQEAVYHGNTYAEVPASTDAIENEVLISEPVDRYVVAADEVDEEGDRIVFGRDAETVADILEADTEADSGFPRRFDADSEA